MKKNPTITNFQIFTLIFFLNTASILVFGLYKELKQDGWLGIIASFVMISFVILIYYFLLRRNKNMDLTMIIKRCLGNSLGKVIVLLYSAYFGYIAFRVFEDLYYLINITMLNDTPKYAIYLPLLVVLTYIVNLGVETIGRTSVIIFIVKMVTTFVVTLIALLNFENFQNLTPLLEDGYKPVVDWSLRQFTVVFGEVVIILVYLRNVKDTVKTLKVVYYALIFNTVYMASVIIMSLILVDPNINSLAVYPIMLAGQMLQLTFIDKVDSLIYFQIMFVSFMKILILFYASTSLSKNVLKKVDIKYISVFIGFIIFLLAMFNNENVLEHFNTGLKIVPIYMHLPMQIGIPLILLLISFFKKNKEKNDTDEIEIAIEN